MFKELIKRIIGIILDVFDIRKILNEMLNDVVDVVSEVYGYYRPIINYDVILSDYFKYFSK